MALQIPHLRKHHCMVYRTEPKKIKPPPPPELELKRLLGRFNLTLSIVEKPNEAYLQSFDCSVVDAEGRLISEIWPLSLKTIGNFDLLSDGLGAPQARVIAGLLQNVKDWVLRRDGEAS